jgi:hypothetical protein
MVNLRSMMKWPQYTTNGAYLPSRAQRERDGDWDLREAFQNRKSTGPTAGKVWDNSGNSAKRAKKITG